METKDILNKRFGKLTVKKCVGLKEDKSGGRKTYYLCQCDCGNEIEVRGAVLPSGGRTSCGCAHRIQNIKDIIGNRFGKLVAKEYNYKNGKHFYLCQCDCGKTAEKESLNPVVILKKTGSSSR